VTVADVIVVGGGIIGLATARAAALRGLSVAVFSVERVGAASRASAGLLVPHYSGEGATEAVARFMVAARDGYPSFAAAVEEESGAHVPLSSSGAIEVAGSADDLAALWAAAPADGERLLPADVAALEPSLAPVAGGVLYPKDGAVDNVRLTDALASIVRSHSRVRVIGEAARRLELGSADPAVIGENGSRVAGRRVVLAAGAWIGEITGVPRNVPVRPLRGQICTLAGAPLRHVVLGAEVYMVSRGGDRTLVGSTMEDVGFDARTTEAGTAALRTGAVAACPALADHPMLEAWAGLRPASPDLLPIIGADLDHPALFYACGHSRNGILLAPMTGSVVAAMVADEPPDWDVSPFAIGRFESARTGANR
jgi:glycine oxidase